MILAFRALVEEEFDHGDILYFNAAYFGPSSSALH